MMLWILRGSFSAIIIGMATYAGLFFVNHYNDTRTGIGAFSLILVVGITAICVDLLIRNKQITTISAVYFGLLLGLVLGALFSMALEPFLSDWGWLQKNPQRLQSIRILITVICCYLTISTLLQTKDE